MSTPEQLPRRRTPTRSRQSLTDDMSDNQSEIEYLSMDQQAEADPFSGLGEQDLIRNLNTTLKDLYTITNRLPDDYVVDKNTATMLSAITSRLTNEAVVNVTAELGTLNHTVVTEVGRLTALVMDLSQDVCATEKKNSERYRELEKKMGLISTKNSTTPNATTAEPTNNNTGSAKGTKPTAPATDIPKTKNPATTNPLDAHHPSRLVIRILPEGIPPNERPDSTTLVKAINEQLSASRDSRNLKVVSVKWNNSGNCVVFTRADQKAADLLKFKDRFIHLIKGQREAVALEDKKWVKIQVNGIRTGAFDPIPGIYSADTLHNELKANNPAYAKLDIISPPRWMRAPEELAAQAYSSIVFATTSVEEADTILREVKTFAAFGRNVFLRRYADRPPVIQCKTCWAFGHMSTACNAKTVRCRLCGQDHTEADHARECEECKAGGEDDMDVENARDRCCTHNLHCFHCRDPHPADARRCPERLRKYGTARANEHTAPTGSNTGWRPVIRRGGPRQDMRGRPNTRAFPVSQNQFANLTVEGDYDPGEEAVDRVLKGAPTGTSRETVKQTMQQVKATTSTTRQ
jgi:hypothetical protein